MRKPIRIYVIGRISQDAHAWTDAVCAPLLTGGFGVFVPKDHNPWNQIRHERYSKKIYWVDLRAMRRSHIGLLLPPYGRDCAWEAGWYAGKGKPVIAFVDSQVEWLRDWMLKGGLQYVVTNNRSTCRKLRRDPILKYASIKFISSIDELHRVVRVVYRRHYE